MTTEYICRSDTGGIICAPAGSELADQLVAGALPGDILYTEIRQDLEPVPMECFYDIGGNYCYPIGSPEFHGALRDGVPVIPAGHDRDVAMSQSGRIDPNPIITDYRVVEAAPVAQSAPAVTVVAEVGVPAPLPQPQPQPLDFVALLIGMLVRFVW